MALGCCLPRLITLKLLIDLQTHVQISVIEGWNLHPEKLLSNMMSPNISEVGFRLKLASLSVAPAVTLFCGAHFVSHQSFISSCQLQVRHTNRISRCQ